MKKNMRNYDLKIKGKPNMSKAQPGPGPIIAGLLIVLFVIELAVLGNLWAINQIAGYFN